MSRVVRQGQPTQRGQRGGSRGARAGAGVNSAPEGLGEKYRRKDFSLGPLGEHEVRIASKSKVSSCVQSAMEHLTAEDEKSQVVLLTACGRAIGVAIQIGEILKRQVEGLHQLSDIGTVAITDEYEPLQDGLEFVSRVRNVSFIKITLSKEPLDTTDPGYQAPLSLSEMSSARNSVDLQSRRKDYTPQEDGTNGRSGDEGNDNTMSRRSRRPPRTRRPKKPAGEAPARQDGPATEDHPPVESSSQQDASTPPLTATEKTVTSTRVPTSRAPPSTAAA